MISCLLCLVYVNHPDAECKAVILTPGDIA